MFIRTLFSATLLPGQGRYVHIYLPPTYDGVTQFPVWVHLHGEHEASGLVHNFHATLAQNVQTCQACAAAGTWCLLTLDGFAATAGAHDFSLLHCMLQQGRCRMIDCTANQTVPQPKATT
jgi:hypothetical protein